MFFNIEIGGSWPEPKREGYAPPQKGSLIKLENKDKGHGNQHTTRKKPTNSRVLKRPRATNAGG
jgi:hypothetical protein